MASLIIGAGVLAYDRVKTAKEKKKAYNSERFSELEKVNAERIANLQRKTCFCQKSDWTGGGCPEHGHAPPYSNAADQRLDTLQDRPLSSRRTSHNDSDEALAHSLSKAQTEGWTRAPAAMDRGEIAKINEERRRKNRGYKRLFTRKS